MQTYEQEYIDGLIDGLKDSRKLETLSAEELERTLGTALRELRQDDNYMTRLVMITS